VFHGRFEAVFAERQPTNSFTPYSFQPEPEIPQARFVLIVKFGGLLRFLISPNQNVEAGENMLRLASD